MIPGAVYVCICLVILSISPSIKYRVCSPRRSNNHCLPAIRCLRRHCCSVLLRPSGCRPPPSPFLLPAVPRHLRYNQKLPHLLHLIKLIFLSSVFIFIFYEWGRSATFGTLPTSTCQPTRSDTHCSPKLPIGKLAI